ncbi:GTP 3',8-cyclase MoaA [Candidatus Bathyarchaeota archaeon]|nr:GTP 3',8-cyclase MoaA [Candidatus Bathyarchaeota archaeon]
MIRDGWGRPVNNLRISLTQRCNFSCFFCHREGEDDADGEATLEEVERIAAIASKLGIRRFKLTGGEPLMRGDILELVERVSRIGEEVSMTTNGSLLADKASELKERGLRRVNISLHSLRRRTFQWITGRDALREVEEGVEASVEAGLNPVKLNMVVMEGVNTEEIPEMIYYSKSKGAILQLIEFQPIQDGAAHWNRFYYDLKTVEEILDKMSERIVERQLHRRRQYHLRGGGVVEVVRPMHNTEFCRYCTRMRVTSDGRLKPCLMRNDNLVELASLMRTGASDEMLIKAFKEAVARREPYWRD